MVGSQKNPFGLRVLAACAVVAGFALAPRAARADATITGVSNPSPAIGQTLCISGFDFGCAQGMSFVKIDNLPVPILAWDNTNIDILVQPIFGTLTLDAPHQLQVFRRNFTDVRACFTGAFNSGTVSQDSNKFTITITSKGFTPALGGSVSDVTLQDNPVITSCTIVPKTDNNLFGYVVTIEGIGFGRAQAMSELRLTLGEDTTDAGDVGEGGAMRDVPILDWTPTRICGYLMGRLANFGTVAAPVLKLVPLFDPADVISPEVVFNPDTRNFVVVTFNGTQIFLPGMLQPQGGIPGEALGDTDQGDTLTFRVRKFLSATDLRISNPCTVTLTLANFTNLSVAGSVIAGSP